MIVIDTNVVLEPLRPAPEPLVVAWLDRQEPRTLFISAISLAELLAGIAALPAGRKRRVLGAALNDELLPLFAGRTLPFDATAAAAFARAKCPR